MLSRILQAKRAGVPIVNYGVIMAHIHGVLHRALSPFPHLQGMIDEAEKEVKVEIEILKKITERAIYE